MKKHEPRLETGETLLWTGTPDEYKDYCRADRWLLPLCAVALAMSTFFLISVAFSVALKGFRSSTLFGLMIGLVVGGSAVYGWFFRFRAKREMKADLAYGITSLGRVIISDHARSKTWSVRPKQPYISEADRRGTGTIYLREKKRRNFLDNTGLDFLSPHGAGPIALYDVPHCKKVLKLLKQAA